MIMVKGKEKNTIKENLRNSMQVFSYKYFYN